MLTSGVGNGPTGASDLLVTMLEEAVIRLAISVNNGIKVIKRERERVTSGRGMVVNSESLPSHVSLNGRSNLSLIRCLLASSLNLFKFVTFL